VSFKAISPAGKPRDPLRVGTRGAHRAGRVDHSDAWPALPWGSPGPCRRSAGTARPCASS